MSEELEIFLEDCDDQLQMMENALVDMQSSGATEDSIGAIFRAVHTIKGSAGMFGFDDIVAFTHTEESLFVNIREGAIKVTTDMIDLFLLCKDHIEKLIAVQTDEIELDDAQKAIGADLIKKLSSYMPSEETQDKEEEHIDVSEITDFTIYEVEKLQNLFLKELEENNEFILDMKLVKKIDMTGIQLLLSLVKSAHTLNKKVELINISKDILQEIKICHCSLALGIIDE